MSALRAVIRGWSLATPLGCDVSTVVESLFSGRRAAQDNARFPAATYGCVLAATIPDDPPRTPHDRVLRRMGRFAYRTAREALDMAGVTPGPRLGLFSGIGGLRAHWSEMLSALADQVATFNDSWKRGLRRLHPFWMLQHLSNNTHALLSKDIDARGEGATYGGANAGAQALASAIWALHAGTIDAALVVAHDSLVEPETVVEMAARGAVTGRPLADLVSPYHGQARGFVPGEAAAAVVLSRVPEASTVAGAPAGAPGNAPGGLALIAAASAGDGDPGAPGVGTLEAVLRGVGLDASARSPHAMNTANAVSTVDVVDGCALADVLFDRDERTRVAELGSRDAPLTAVQSAMGQLGAAAPLVQAICLASCLHRGELPPIAGLADPAEGPLMPVSSPEKTDRRSAVCLSAGAPGLAGAVRVLIPAMDGAPNE